jgi:peptidyl-prolyl cis-trans isomerase B (cyclophilin B)
MKKMIFLIAVMLSSIAQSQDQSGAENPQATIHTNRGDIRIELFANEAPTSVDNFLRYARDGYYDGTIFHRVISHFMIQGGGMTADMQQKPTREPIVNEADNGLSNVRGTIAMARTNDIDSATSQFFINVELNAGLDHTGKGSSREWGYAVFGKVVEGMDVVDDIRFVETGPNDVPRETVLIESVEVH